MSDDADAACRRSRDQLAAGVAVRLLDYLAERPNVRSGWPCLLAMREGIDHAEVGRGITAGREWTLVAADDSVSPVNVHRLVARAFGADHTGTRPQVLWQLDQALALNRAPTVLVLAGTRPLTFCQTLIRMIAAHPACTLAVLTNVRTMESLARFASWRMAVLMRTPKQIERVRRSVAWLKRQERRRSMTVV